MKKTLLFISTGFVGLTLLAALFGKITFEQFGYITPLVLSILYGIYQKVLNGEKDATIEIYSKTLEDMISYNTGVQTLLENQIILLDKENTKLSSQVEAYAITSRNLRAGFDSEKQVEDKQPVEKPKRTRKK
jgi:hypothetical protein